MRSVIRQGGVLQLAQRLHQRCVCVCGGRGPPRGGGGGHPRWHRSGIFLMGFVIRQEGGLQQAQRLHQRMGQLIWTCRGWHGLGMAAQHFSRGDDLTAYALGIRAWSPSGPCLMHHKI